MKRTLIFSLLLFVWLVGCAKPFPTSQPVPTAANAALVIPTLSERSTATQTAVEATIGAAAQTATVSPQVTLESTATATAVPPATAISSATATSIPQTLPTAIATIGATAVAPTTVPSTGPRIISFTSSATAVDPGQSFTLSWEAEGGAVQVCLADIIWWTYDCTDVALSGSQTFVGGQRAGVDSYILQVHHNEDLVTQQLGVQINCLVAWDAVWGIAQPTGCPVAPYTTKAAVIQPFEHGVMIWLEESRQIYALAEGHSYSPIITEDTWTPDLPESDPTIIPPAGFYQPVRGFGLIWRTQSFYDNSYTPARDALGWATAPEAPVTVGYQCYNVLWKWGAGYLQCYLLTADKIYLAGNGAPFGSWREWSR